MHTYHQIAFTPAVKLAQARYGSAAGYAGADEAPGGPVRNSRLGPAEEAFIAARDGFYLASVSETGWPYVQFRGGPPGFLHVLDGATLGYADFRGNRQYITTGNVAGNDRVSLFLMDYANRRRLKVFGHAEIADAADRPDLADRLRMPDYRGRVERLVLIHIVGYDWNCPQHITPRYTAAEVAGAMQPLQDRIAALELENAGLRGQASSGTKP